MFRPQAICIAFAALACVCSAGCESSTSSESVSTYNLGSTSGEKTESSTVSTTTAVVVIGDDTSADVTARLSGLGYSVSTDLESVTSSLTVVVAEDAPNGVRAVHQRIAKSFGEEKPDRVLWLFTEMSKIDDLELMQLMQEEVRELLTTSGFSDDRVRFAVDTEATTVPATTIKGWSGVEEFLRSAPSRSN